MYAAAVLAPVRPFQNWVLLPPEPPERSLTFTEAPYRDLLWSWPTLACTDAATGRDQFTGTLSERNRVWKEFRNYVRQAHTYDAAAQLVADRTRALLQYYRMLNLAKAELLREVPEQIIGKTIPHGLSVKRTRTGSITGDRLVVKPGVFPLLYKSRTGRTLSSETLIPVARLIGLIPEIGMERKQARLGESLVCSILHSVRMSGDSSWSALVLFDRAPILASSTTRQLLAASYEETELPPDWKSEFAISRRLSPQGVTFYQSKWILPNPRDVLACARRAHDSFAPFIGYSHTQFDGELFASLYRSKDFAFPAELARYALVFYLSSLVRYYPSVLDPVSQPAQSWFFDRFVHDSDIPMLIDATSRIRGNNQRYFGGEASIRA